MRDVRLRQHHASGLDAHRAAAGHGVSCVAGQVENRALNLADIDRDRRKPVLRRHGHGDTLAHNALQHGAHVANRGVEIHVYGAEHLSSGIGQQLTRELRSPDPGFVRQLRLLPLGRSVRQLRHQHLRRDEDHRQQVVEIVGNTSCEPADHIGLRHLLPRQESAHSCQQEIRHQRIAQAIVGTGLEGLHGGRRVGRRNTGDDDRHESQHRILTDRRDSLRQWQAFRHGFDDQQIGRLTECHRADVVTLVGNDQTGVTTESLYRRMPAALSIHHQDGRYNGC